MNSTDEPTLWQSGLIDSLMPAFLLGIAQVPCLGNNLVLKGGAALRHYYFPRTRYSNDLDYSALSQLPQGGQLKDAVMAAAERAHILLGNKSDERTYAIELERSFKPVAMRSFQFVFEWKPCQEVRIGLDISLDEPIVRAPQQLFHLTFGWQADPVTKTLVYSLEEIVAEKLRAILQWTRQLKQTGRSDMPVARTYFDLHYLLMRRPDLMASRGFVELLQEKCRIRGVSFSGAASFFDAELLAITRVNWSRQLCFVTTGVLPAERLLNELERVVKTFLY